MDAGSTPASVGGSINAKIVSNYGSTLGQAVWSDMQGRGVMTSTPAGTELHIGGIKLA